MKPWGWSSTTTAPGTSTSDPLWSQNSMIEKALSDDAAEGGDGNSHERMVLPMWSDQTVTYLSVRSAMCRVAPARRSFDANDHEDRARRQVRHQASSRVDALTSILRDQQWALAFCARKLGCDATARHGADPMPWYQTRPDGWANQGVFGNAGAGER